MQDDRRAAALEAVLMVVDEPIGTAELAATLELPEPEVEALLRSLAAEYDAGGRGFELRSVAGGRSSRTSSRGTCSRGRRRG